MKASGGETPPSFSAWKERCGEGARGQDGKVGQIRRVRLVGWAAVVGLLCVSAVSIASSRTFAQTARPEMTRAPQFDNDRAVSWKSVIPPHTESTLHRHDRYRTVVGIVGGELTTVDAQGRKTVTRYETGKCVLAGADARPAPCTRT